MLSKVLLILTTFVSACAVVPENLSESEINAFLSSHNKLRSELGLPDLVWDSALATFAEGLASKCIRNHTEDNEYGENLYASSPKNTDHVIVAKDAVALWASEVQNVDSKWECIFVSQGTCGHYSQIVWKASKYLGCSIVHCPVSRQNNVVCEYNPSGNYEGQVPY